ncbi:MAG: sarcosine oxidase subunit gamma [Rhizobiaceae bacterium]
MARAAKKVAAPSAERRPAHAGREIRNAAVTVAVLPPAERMSLRAPAASVAALSKALKVKLPVRPKSSASEGKRHALWLGPDEWLVIDDASKHPLADVAGVKALHSAVGISHRNIGLSVSGAGVEATLSAGCPQDLALAAFPVGAASRTILGKVEIVLFRTGADAFRIECWRSFSDYVLDFLEEAAGDAA